MIKQLLSTIAWDVDYLIIDTPPGTSDEHLTVMENIRWVGSSFLAIILASEFKISKNEDKSIFNEMVDRIRYPTVSKLQFHTNYLIFCLLIFMY